MALFFDILSYVFLAVAIITGTIANNYTGRLMFETEQRLPFGRWLKQSFGDTSAYNPEELVMVKKRDFFKRIMLFYGVLAILCAVIRYTIEPW